MHIIEALGIATVLTSQREDPRHLLRSILSQHKAQKRYTGCFRESGASISGSKLDCIPPPFQSMIFLMSRVQKNLYLQMLSLILFWVDFLLPQNQVNKSRNVILFRLIGQNPLVQMSVEQMMSPVVV